MEFYFPSKTWNQNLLLSSYHNGRKTEITFCIINNWKLENWLEEQSSSIQFLALHSWYGWSIKVGWWLANWLGGWPTGAVSYHITTSWLHLASWNLLYSQLSWVSKMEPSVATNSMLNYCIFRCDKQLKKWWCHSVCLFVCLSVCLSVTFVCNTCNFKNTPISTMEVKRALPCE